MPNALTDAFVKAAKVPERGQVTITDRTLQNFALRLSQGGSKTFVVLLGKGKRQTLGRYPTLSLAEARSAAKRILAERELGKTFDRTTFDDAVADFLADCAGRLRPRSLKNYRDYLALLPFGRRDLSSITTRELVQILNKQTKSQKEHLHRIARTLFRFAERHRLIDRSPLDGLPLPAGASRSRVLTEDELRAVYRTARASPGIFHVIVALLCLTGQRRGEISHLEWGWIGADTITLPAHATKNGRPHTFPYGEGTASVLASVPRLSDRYVFPAARQRSEHTTVFNGFSKAKLDFDSECGVTGYTLHDLRRSYSSFHAKLGTPQIVVEKLLNHVSGGTLSPIATVYNVHRYEAEMREAVLKWESYLATL